MAPAGFLREAEGSSANGGIWLRVGVADTIHSYFSFLCFQVYVPGMLCVKQGQGNSDSLNNDEKPIADTIKPGWRK